MYCINIVIIYNKNHILIVQNLGLKKIKCDEWNKNLCSNIFSLSYLKPWTISYCLDVDYNGTIKCQRLIFVLRLK